MLVGPLEPYKYCFCEKIMFPMFFTSQFVIFFNHNSYDSCMLFSVQVFNYIISNSPQNNPESSYQYPHSIDEESEA